MERAEHTRGPLNGVKVLDFSRILSGPYASMILADLGAEVIKIEPTEKGDETRSFPPFLGGMSHYYMALNRSKKSVTLNLKSDEGVRIAKGLAAQSDIVLENFRPGIMDKLGLGYEELTSQNPSLIYCSITGFGTKSPYGDKPAFDIVAQALSGVMSVNCEPGQAPNKLGLPLGDMAGSIFSLFGILAALHERNSTGRGRRVEIAMLDSLIAMQGYLSQIYFVTGESPKPVGTQHPSLVPYGAYPTSDGHVIVACLTEKFWHNFARSLERSDLIEDPRFSVYETRLRNRRELEPIILERMSAHSTAYWLDRLTTFDVPNAPILSVGEALEQDHVTASRLVETVHHPEIGNVRLVRSPINFDGEGPAPASPPSLLGENTYEVLSQKLGLTKQQLDNLKERAVIS
jgi:crotonobetainyl-CoA:carnitine CoA-transferase CaiB-like acyl-CoA transferase